MSSLGLVRVYEYTLECLPSYRPSICFYACSKYHELDMVRMYQQECCIDYIPYHKKWTSTRDLYAYRICADISHKRHANVSSDVRRIEVKSLNLAFIYIHTLCVRAEKAVASLRICTDSPEPSLFGEAISTEIPCTCSNDFSN